MQISGSDLSYIHTSVIQVRPQSSSMQKKGVWADREEPQAVIYIENGPTWLAESDGKTNELDLVLEGWTSAETFSLTEPHIWTVVSEQNVTLATLAPTTGVVSELLGVGVTTTPELAQPQG